VLASIGVIAAGAFAVLAIRGQSQYNDCYPHGCGPSTVTALRTERGIAFAALGIGVASLGAAGWLLFSRPAHTD
jgi:hypothetical protein